MKRLLFTALWFAALAGAQNPNTAKFPAAIATDQDLLVAKDRAASTLSSGITNVTLSIPVANGALFTNYTAVTIDNEQILICTVAGNTLNACAVGRGFSGTVAVGHASGAAVRANIVAWYHNQAAAEVKAVETALGVSLANVEKPLSLNSPLSRSVNTVSCPTCLVSTGSYADPSWLTSLAGAKISGAVPTATALASDPTACPANQWVIDLAANGGLSCSQPAFTNISGTAATTQGGTGADISTCAAGRVYFAGASGVVSCNDEIFWDNTFKSFRIGSATSATNYPVEIHKSAAHFMLNATGASQQATFFFADQGTTKWQFGKQGDNSFFMYDAAAGNNVFYTNSGGGDFNMNRVFNALVSLNATSASGYTRPFRALAFASFPGTCTDGDFLYRTNPSTPGQVLYVCASNAWNLAGDGGGGSGDVTDVGDCSTGACFTAAGTGTALVLKNATSGSVTLQTVAGALGTVTASLPAATGTVALTSDIPTGAAYVTTQAEGALSSEVSLGALADNSIVAVDVAASVATPRAAAYTDVVPLWASGSCSGYLKSDGTCDAGGSGYATIQNEATPLTQRATVNFTGAGVDCADDAGNTRTNCTIAGGGSSITYGAVADLPATCATGDQYRTSDSLYEYQCTATNTWAAFHRGQRVVPPVSTGWSWDNDGGVATVSSTHGFEYLVLPKTSGINSRWRCRNAPAAPYTLKAALIYSASGDITQDGTGENAFSGIAFRESATGKLIPLYAGPLTGTTSNVKFDKWTTSTNFTANYAQYTTAAGDYLVSGLKWYAIRNDDTNLSVYTTIDGLNWDQFDVNRAKADFFTTAPDEICVGAYVNASAAVISLISWETQAGAP